jgi:hypothetical protein
MRCPAAANRAVLDWHAKKRLVAKVNNTQQRAKLTMSVGSEQAVLVVHVIGDLLTLQIPTSVIEINESGRIHFSGRTIVQVSEPMGGINSLLDTRTMCTNAAMMAQT